MPRYVVVHLYACGQLIEAKTTQPARYTEDIICVWNQQPVSSLAKAAVMNEGSLL